MLLDKVRDHMRFGKKGTSFGKVVENITGAPLLLNNTAFLLQEVEDSIDVIK